VNVENKKLDFLGPSFLEIQKEATYTYGIAKIVFSPFVAMKTFWGTASTASIYFNFGTRCCGMVSCPLEEHAVSTTWEHADVPEPMFTNVFGIPWKSVLRKWFELRQKLGVSDLCGVFLYHLHMLGQLHAVSLFLMIVLIELSEINDSVVTEKGNLRKE
jgi:hypothetical protein